MINPLTAIGFTLFISFIFSELSHHFKYPRVLGQLTAGILIGFPFFRAIIDATAVQNIEFLSELGVIFLFLVIGMEIDITKLKQERRRSTILGLVSIGVPIVMGYFAGQLLGYSEFTSLIIGVCLSITSESTNTQLFMELGLLKKRLAKVIFGAAMIDDVFAIVFLAILIPILNGDLQAAASIPIKFIAFAAVIWGLLRVMPFFVTHIEEDESNIAEVGMMVVFGLVVAILSIQLGLGAILGAFIAGVIIQISLRHECNSQCGTHKQIHRKHKEIFLKNVENLKVMTLSFIIPFFFIHMGLQLDVGAIFTHPITIGVILIAGMLGKFIAAFISKFSLKLTWAQTAIVGWGMNSRGMIELVIAELALAHEIINDEVYAALVVLVIVSIFSFPIALKKIIAKNPEAMG
jgi:Kef-type K+ transport system membrane component KefB